MVRCTCGSVCKLYMLKHRWMGKGVNLQVDPCDATFGSAKKVTAVLVADTGTFQLMFALLSCYSARLRNALTADCMMW